MTEEPSLPVLIYQMGKVGSSSIAASLRQAGVPVHQVHRLNLDNIARVRREHTNRGWANPPADAEGERVYEQFIRPRVPLKVITLVREPIGRNVSYYFQNLDKIWNLSSAHQKVTVEELISAFQIDYPYSDDPLRWFDYEFFPTLGIDVYRHPFQQGGGSLVISSAGYDVLILRTDLADAAKSVALGDFLRIPAPQIVSANVTAQKEQRDAYKVFLALIRMVPEYVERMLESKFSRHFFKSGELLQLKNRYLSQGSVIPDDFILRWGSPPATPFTRVA